MCRVNGMKKIFGVILICLVICIIVVIINVNLQSGGSDKKNSILIKKEATELLNNVSNIAVSEVDKIEVLKWPWIDGLGYHLLEPEEYDKTLEMIKSGYGKSIPNPEPVGGGSVDYYITTKDGSRYIISNNGLYFVINGIAYEMEEDWDIGYDDIIVDNPVPKDFEY